MSFSRATGGDLANNLKKQLNIIGTVVTGIVICVSGFGTYAFQGFLAELKKDLLEELRVESENRLKNEFESLKNFFKQDLKKDIQKLNLESKEMISEVETLLFKERLKIKGAFKEELDKCFSSLKRVGEEVNRVGEETNDEK
ncbi:hypothetical protein BDCR2A_01409 [Borrelia duttonii CR2A]|uniref:Uncharacterized protein n=1 Tax=Borrelia duttonii CR2A TaxID=1432657 RepID=W6TGS7_9SPIR|nr:hypothetical protein BDCR2A_01423 [Borrelia duttonii CR2A]ETZ17665.1 hypothetical protein BDCR2A_01409 [Borrelia duttonii CR2A]